MEKESEQKLPYEENAEGFARWFRETAEEKWRNYLKSGSKRGIPLRECDAMRAFLLEYGTHEEIQAKLDAFLISNILAYEALLEELKSGEKTVG